MSADALPRGETAQGGKPSPLPREAYREKPSWWMSTITYIPRSQAAPATAWIRAR